MTKDNESKKPRTHHLERVVLSTEALERVIGWKDAVTPHLRGSSFSRSDLVNWLIVTRPAALLESEVSSITRAFFDPLKAVVLGTRLIKERQQAGEEVDVKAFIDIMLTTSPPRAKRQPSKPKTTPEPEPQS